MFGCVACYLNGRLVLLLADRREPFQGLLVPTEKSFQASLRSELPALSVHPMLGKWLYLPHSTRRFAATAASLVEMILGGDERIGVESKGGGLPRRRRPS